MKEIFDFRKIRKMSTRTATNFDEETKQLYDLMHYAGITIDPGLFQNIVELLKHGKMT